MCLYNTDFSGFLIFLFYVLLENLLGDSLKVAFSGVALEASAVVILLSSRSWRSSGQDT